MAFAAVALALVPAIALGAGFLGTSAPWVIGVAMGTFVLAMALTAGLMRSHYPHTRLGGCNTVTQIRAAMAALLLIPVLNPAIWSAQPVAIFALAAVALTLDGVDGWLARRTGLTSAFGARFDMEVDAALSSILALILLGGGAAPDPITAASLLILGFARHVFVLVARALPWLRAPLPERLSRKTVCVLQISALISMLLPAITPLAPVLLPAAAAALIWSFARDILWLRRAAG